MLKFGIIVWWYRIFVYICHIKINHTMRVQDIAKKLVKEGFTKKTWDTKLNCNIGDFEIRAFNYNGVHSTLSLNHGVFNEQYKGASIEKVMDALTSFGLKYENRNGLIAILK